MKLTKTSFPLICLFFGLTSCFSCKENEPMIFEPPTSPEDSISLIFPDVDFYLTQANGTRKLELLEDEVLAYSTNPITISIDSESQLQAMEGFGFALTGGSASHIQGMSQQARTTLLNELFGLETGEISLNFIRISLGASDLDETPFSYADTPDGEPDPALSSFSIAPDRINLIPTIKEIQAINPSIKIMASPWSPPSWMKSNGSTIGGSLLAEYYDEYASYFVKYIQAMEAEGINIDFISIQNEPLHDGNNPSLYMSASEQTEFIKSHLGPVFSENDIETKILIYDHNADRVDYPIAVLSDSEANRYIYGSAFHLYAGQISQLSSLRTAHPDKHIFFTEQWYGSPGNFSEDLKWHIREVIIGSIRNWSEGVIEWNLSSNPTLTPYTDGGCDQCLGAITIDGDEVVRNAGYYVMGHVSAFVPSGSVRIGSSYDSSLPNVVFLTPDDQIVLLVLNDSSSFQSFSVQSGKYGFTSSLDPGSVATFIWGQEIPD